MSLIKIAVVDDHKLFRQGIMQILAKNDRFDPIFEADSYAQLVERMALQIPDIILMDIEMPGTDGFDACKQLLEKFPNVKIIALSMHNADKFIFQMMKVGARSYLPKDVDQDRLREAIEEVYLKGFYFTDEITGAMLRGVKANYRQKQILEYNEMPLTKREKEILSLICDGLTTCAIAEQLYISIRTVEGHRKNLLEKTGMANSVSLAVYAFKNGMLE